MSQWLSLIHISSLGLTICAERNAIFSAVAAGNRRIEAIALACIDADADAKAGSRLPCGACRQVIAEFGEQDIPIIVDKVGILVLQDILPRPFVL